jgi:hypothetical protein
MAAGGSSLTDRSAVSSEPLKVLQQELTAFRGLRFANGVGWDTPYGEIQLRTDRRLDLTGLQAAGS